MSDTSALWRPRCPWARHALMVVSVFVSVALAAGTPADEDLSIPVFGQPLDGAVVGLALSADGKLLACAVDKGPARLLDGVTGKKLGLIGATVASHLAFMPGDRTLLTASLNLDSITTCAIAGDDCRRLFQLPQQGIIAFALSADRRRCATAGGDGSAWVCDLSAGQRTKLPATGAVDVALSPDGTLIATGHKDRIVRLWDGRTGRPRQTLAGHTGWVRRIAFSPDGQLVASASDDGTMMLWEVATAQLIRRHGPQRSSVSSLAFAADGVTLATGGRSGDVRLWNVTTGKGYVLTAHESEVTALVFAPDNSALITGCRDQVVRCWQLPPRREEVVMPLSAAALDTCWAHLAASDAGLAYTAIQSLCAAHEQAVPFLMEKMRFVDVAPARSVEQLVLDLNSDAFAIREQAARALIELGPIAEPELSKALAGQMPLETRRRIQRILASEALPARLSPQALRTLRGVQALERIGSRRALLALDGMATRFVDLRLARAAGSAADRLRRRMDSSSPAGPE